MRVLFALLVACAVAALALYVVVTPTRASLAMWGAPPAKPPAKVGLLNSRSNEYPRLTAPYSDTPASCWAAYKQLDSNRDSRLDADIFSGKKKLDAKDADQCIADKGWAWAYYLKGRTLAAMLKFDEAARHAEAAIAVLRQPGPIPPPADDIWLFRANALMDAGRAAEAKPIYDALISKRPNDRLLFQLRDSPIWPPPAAPPSS